jgi:hypothetical protein
MYLDNKYTHWYYNIVNAAKARSKPTGYTEKHHIIPESLGGSNKQENLVHLTAKEHYTVHHLLIKMLTGKNKAKMIVAYWCLCNRKNTKITNKQYEQARILCSQALKEMWCDPESTYNSASYRIKLSEANKIAQNKPEVRNNRSIITKKNRNDPNSSYNTKEYKQKHQQASKISSNKEENKLKRANSIARKYMVTDPNGVSFTIKNMAKFCRENNLSKQNMNKVSKGTRVHHMGWKCYKL